jgi:RNA polymerase sigma-70 factor (ECF subfamily)
MHQHDCHGLQGRLGENRPPVPAATDPPTIEEILEAARRVLDAPATRQRAAQLRLNRADLEDVAQEVLLKAWRARDRYSRAFQLRTWVAGITRNAMLDLYRKQRRRRARPLTDHEGRPCVEVVAGTPGPADALAHRELAAHLAEALAQAPPVVRQVAALRDEGRTFAEAAAALGRKPAAVVTLWHRFKVRTLARWPEV